LRIELKKAPILRDDTPEDDDVKSVNAHISTLSSAEDQYKRRNKEARNSILTICDEEVDCREASMQALKHSANSYLIERESSGATMLSYKWLLDSVSYYKCLPCPSIST
jgi:hypothetical protein